MWMILRKDPALLVSSWEGQRYSVVLILDHLVLIRIIWGLAIENL